MSEAEVDILEGLEERLQSHAKAFESLLALTPAQDYYGTQILDGRDPSEQWRAKKQTKEEKRAAKKAKLDPANQKSALDVMKEREQKRKRELGMEDGEDELQDQQQIDSAKPSKKRKTEETEEEAESRRKAKADKKKEKREKKKAKASKLKAKREAEKAAKQDADLTEAQVERRQAEKAAQPEVEADESDDDEAEPMSHPTDMEQIDMSGLADSVDDEEQEEEDAEHIDMAGLADSEPPEDLAELIAGENEGDEASSAPTSPQIDSPAFDVATNHSATSSSSSIVPPPLDDSPEPTPQATQKQKPLPALDIADAQPTGSRSASAVKDIPSGTSSPRLHLPEIDQAALQERLRARIEELRARRKADGPEGKPAKSRQELLEQRRKKEEQRKAHKKELRRKAKDDEARKQDERLRGSGSPLSADIFGPGSPRPEQSNKFSFSRLAFEDGTTADPSLTGLQEARKKKGPQDPRGALQAAENKRKRVSGYDAEKQADIAEKDLWLNAKKRAHGERVRDDTSLLKKALKRKEQTKNKSEKAWKEREEGVRHGKEMRQKKRESNLQKRKDEKGQHGKKKPGSGGAKGAKGKGKPKGRPGFEGRFKA